jgi:hypothetical protein
MVSGMLRMAALVLFFGLTSCFPFDDGPPEASEEQINTMLSACRLNIRQLERYDDQWLVTIDDREPNRAAKAACLNREQSKLGVEFAMAGNFPVP